MGDKERKSVIRHQERCSEGGIATLVADHNYWNRTGATLPVSNLLKTVLGGARFSTHRHRYVGD